MTNPTYTVPYRRKREGRTDYKKRLALLKSRKTRFIIRKTNTQIVIQAADYEADGDNIKITVTGKQLREEHSWDHNTKNIPSAYLTGVIAAKTALENGIEEGITDIGLHTPHRGSRVFAALQGLIDGGLDIPADESVFPPQNRLRGEHIDEDITTDFEALTEKLL